jgi:hypothetical protein
LPRPAHKKPIPLRLYFVCSRAISCSLERSSSQNQIHMIRPQMEPRRVATGGAQAMRSEPERNPWLDTTNKYPAPEGQRNRPERAVLERPSLRPGRGDFEQGILFHRLRSAEDSLASPVATTRRPLGAKSRTRDAICSTIQRNQKCPGPHTSRPSRRFCLKISLRFRA